MTTQTEETKLPPELRSLSSPLQPILLCKQSEAYGFEAQTFSGYCRRVNMGMSTESWYLPCVYRALQFAFLLSTENRLIKQINKVNKGGGGYLNLLKRANCFQTHLQWPNSTQTVGITNALICSAESAAVTRLLVTWWPLLYNLKASKLHFSSKHPWVWIFSFTLNIWQLFHNRNVFFWPMFTSWAYAFLS